MPVCLYSIIERNAQRGCMHSARNSSERRCDRAPVVRTRGAACRLSPSSSSSQSANLSVPGAVPSHIGACWLLFCGFLRYSWTGRHSIYEQSCVVGRADFYDIRRGDSLSHETKLALDCPSHHRSSAGRNAFCDISFAIYSYALCLCQAFNLLAYGYSPTSLVAPVGAIGVLVNGEPHEAGSV